LDFPSAATLTEAQDRIRGDILAPLSGMAAGSVLTDPGADTTRPDPVDPPVDPVVETSEPPGERLPREVPINVRSVALSLVAVAVAIALLNYMQPVLIPIVLAALLFYALDPFVDRMHRWRIPRAIGALIMVLVTITSLFSLAYFLRDEVLHIVEQLPQGIQRARDQWEATSTPDVIDKVQKAAKELEEPTPGTEPAEPTTPSGATRVQIEEPVFDASSYLWNTSITAMTLANQGIMILFLTYFMLLSDDLFKRKLVELVGPTLTKKKITVKILEDIAGQIESFLRLQVFTSTIVAVATAAALWALGLQGAALWGFVSGVLNSIPYYGPLLVTSALAVVAFLQFGSLTMTGTVAAVALLITTLEGYVLTPALMGRVAEMNKVAMFGGLLFWSWIWGIPGLLLAVPMMMAIKTVCDRVEDLEPIGRLLSE
jgi:predicted PurR-regulated permease PerM